MGVVRTLHCIFTFYGVLGKMSCKYDNRSTTNDISAVGKRCSCNDVDSKSQIIETDFLHALQLAKTQLYRDMPWRESANNVFDPYKILVSEMMLQQTQVTRVIPKFLEFTQQFATCADLAQASLADVLRLWSGLGYNRRAKYLHDAAKQLYKKQTWSYDDLVICKGIGPNTAKAVLVYSNNQPHVFIETNIRTVFVHYFFADRTDIPDTAILDLVQKHIDTKQPRIWYWALMDLGSFLKQHHNTRLAQVRAYKKQSKFGGSRRQIRGAVLKHLAISNGCNISDMQYVIQDERLNTVLDELINENLIHMYRGAYYLGTRS